MTGFDAVDAACRSVIDAALRAPLSTRVTADGRQPLTLVDGYVPLLVDHTEEDREAQGLRKLQADQAPRVPVHDTVLEAANRERLLMLTGPPGSGKHTSLMHLALHLAGATVGDARWTLATLARPVPRNDAGTVVVERWTGPPMVPLVLDPADTLDASLRALGAIGRQVLDGALDALLLVDRAERLGERGPAWLVDAARLAERHGGLRVVVAGDAGVCGPWPVPGAFARRRIVPLFDAQRDALRALLRPDARALPSVDVDVANDIALLTLALENGDGEGEGEGSAIAVADRWLADAERRDAERRGTSGDRERLAQPFLRDYVESRRLAALPAAAVGALYHADPTRWSSVVHVLARRLVAAGRTLDALVAALMSGDPGASAHGVIDAVRIAADAAGHLDAPSRRNIHAALVPIVEQARSPLALRVKAGRALALDGDPRDLDALVAIAAGPFTMGSNAHPNSAPPHVVTLAAYRIGRYPVTNDRYRRFVEATGRAWRSKDGLLPLRANGPAVDLTWHDACAYCDWLTAEWRMSGRIADDAIVRLPTEPEWERAARGLQGGDGLVWPWPGGWQDDRANAQEAGINDTCTVGLFPAGRSADGCDDMAGQVWEWTTTLWGEDMATPRFAYPYADDGREALDAPAGIRRVLRGGCFLSPREKANCTYRGSLEPDGFWRGNGFRIVVVPG